MGQCVMKDCGFEYNKNPQCETQKLKGFLKEVNNKTNQKIKKKIKIKLILEIESEKKNKND